MQGQGLTLEDAAVLFYNALTASTAENQTYAATLGFTVTDGRIDLSSVLLSSVEGPFVADGTTQLPFVPAAVYRNDTVATDAALNAYDVYYYSASARTVWIYSRKAAGRITAVSPSASAAVRHSASSSQRVTSRFIEEKSLLSPRGTPRALIPFVCGRIWNDCPSSGLLFLEELYEIFIACLTEKSKINQQKRQIYPLTLRFFRRKKKFRGYAEGVF